MKRLMLFLLFISFLLPATAQSISRKLSDAFSTFEQDPQMKAGVSSLYVMDARTGKVVFSKNAAMGLAPASTQKIITAATAYELLGKDFRFQTELRYDGNIRDSALEGNVYIIGDGDPTLGSWRWKETSDTAIIRKWSADLRRKGIAKIRDGFSFIAVENRFETQTIPDGWIWQDIGNYYGAGSRGLNWKENQFDLVLRSGSTLGETVQMVQNGLYDDFAEGGLVRNEIKAAPKGSGDNAYIYFPPFSNGLYLSGTIPVNEKNFSISGSVPYPYLLLLQRLSKGFAGQGKPVLQSTTSFISPSLTVPENSISISRHASPSLDSIVYWFQRRSINLYGEALLKRMALQQTGFGATDTGVRVVKDFWKGKGIDPVYLNIVDGSGLSPLNRVTTEAQVRVLQYAKRRPWFAGYYLSFPEFNGMKMKSGTINGVKGFAGYHTSKAGTEYIFAFLVNNYNGSSAALVQKMYAVLDVLK